MTIKWEQAQPVTGEILTIAQMSEEYFVLCMARAFGDFGSMPIRLTKDDLPVLRGMASCWAETAQNPYLQMIKFIERVGDIKVWQTHKEKANG